MKAILMIELDDEWLDRINLTCEDMFADVVIYKKESLENQCDYSQRIYRCWCPLKPMPERKKVGEIERVDDFMKSEIRVIAEKVEAQIRLDTELLLATGYNACIDEILGEKND